MKLTSAKKGGQSTNSIDYPIYTNPSKTFGNL